MGRRVKAIYGLALDVWTPGPDPLGGGTSDPEWMDHISASLSLLGLIAGALVGAGLGWDSGAYMGIVVITPLGAAIGFGVGGFTGRALVALLALLAWAGAVAIVVAALTLVGWIFGSLWGLGK